MAESDSLAGVWRGDGSGFVAKLAAPVGVDPPRVVLCVGRPVGGESEVLGDGLAEIVGDIADEPSVKLVAFTHWVG